MTDTPSERVEQARKVQEWAEVLHGQMCQMGHLPTDECSDWRKIQHFAAAVRAATLAELGK